MCKWCENNKVWLFDFIFFICFFLLGSLTLDDLLFSSLLLCQVDLNWYIFFELIIYFFWQNGKFFLKKIIAPRALTGVKLGLLIKGDICVRGTFGGG
jgi:hypothetical protein